MPENELAEVIGDVPAIPVAEEEPAVETPAPDEPAALDPKVDESPTTETLKAEIAELEQKKGSRQGSRNRMAQEKSRRESRLFQEAAGPATSGPGTR